MLVLTRKKKQSLMLGDEIEIQVLEVNGDQVRLGVRAPRSLRVLRKEIYAAVDSENKAAAAAVDPEFVKKLAQLGGFDKKQPLPK